MVVAASLADQIIGRLNQEEVVWIAASLDSYWDVAVNSNVLVMNGISQLLPRHKVEFTRDTNA